MTSSAPNPAPPVTHRPAPTPPARPRITVIEKLYHQNPGEQPTSHEHQFVRELRPDEQPYARSFKVTEEWRALDVGWIEVAGMLILRNDEGQFRDRIPTPEQRAEAARKVIEVRFCDGADPALYVPPGETARFQPAALTRVHVRCQYGMAKSTIHLSPV